ncbi:MAG TPA: NTP transferase domain-containing protein [Rectinemataceae bacterium]|nr:NTP transferase domain-containing protein [Rectinemataceae bacterium]
MIVRSCVIPAAGASSRMGDWKPLLSWASSTILETVLSSVLEAGLEAILVAGFRGEELHALFDGRPSIRVVDNPAWREGMLGSVLAGARATEGEAFFVTPADMPKVGSGLYRRLIAVFEEGQGRSSGREGLSAGGPPTLFAACAAKAGHPVLIPRALIAGMSRLDRGDKLRDFLMRGRWELVETGDPAVLADIDTRADYEAALG